MEHPCSHPTPNGRCPLIAVGTSGWDVGEHVDSRAQISHRSGPHQLERRLVHLGDVALGGWHMVGVAGGLRLPGSNKPAPGGDDQRRARHGGSGTILGSKRDGP